MKKKFIAATMAAAVLSLGVCSGCFLNTTVSVTSIEKTQTIGLVDYYTITYSDGSTSQFTVTNGKDGADGKDGESAQPVTAEDVYNTYKKVYGEELTFLEFCEKFVASDGNNTAALNSLLRSCLKVYTVFKEWSASSGLSPVLYGGSAVVYKMDEEYTYILTNYHVIYDDKAYGSKISAEISAYLYGSESEPISNGSSFIYDDYAIKCEYVGGSIAYDVAVIKAKTEDVTAINPQVVPVTVNTKFNVGDHTYAVGNPDDGGISVTKGIVSVDSEYINLAIDSTTRRYRSIRTDTAITHGSSGGGLFNLQGELIGLNNAGDEDITSMNYAIPASALVGIADGILYYNQTSGQKTTYKAVLGITSQSFNSRYVYDLATGDAEIVEEVTVNSVAAGSLAELLGIKSGDIITSITINGKLYEVSRQFQISDALLTARAGDRIKMGYKRGGEDFESEEQAVRGVSDIKDVDKLD